jgi:hypothetical protein
MLEGATACSVASSQGPTEDPSFIPVIALFSHSKSEQKCHVHFKVFIAHVCNELSKHYFS